MEGGVENARLDLIGDAGFELDFAARAEEADLVAIADVFEFCVGWIEGENVLGDDFGIAGAAGHGAAVVVLQQAPGGEDEREFRGVGFEFAGFLPREEVEVTEAALEGLLMENLGVGAISGDGPLLAIDVEVFPSDAPEEGDDSGNLGEHAVRCVVGLREPETLQHLAHDLTVGLGAGQRFHGGVHTLHAALGIGEGAALLEEARCRKNDVGIPGCLGHEDLLHDEELETLHGMADVM